MTTNSTVSIQINKINLVTGWKYNCLNDKCICNSKLVDNNTNNKSIIKSTCNHAFHKSCLDNHLILTQTCPICNTDWVFSQDLEHSEIKLYRE